MNKQKLGSLGPKINKKPKKKNNFTVVKDDKLTNVKTFDNDLTELRANKNKQDQRTRIKRFKQRKNKSKDLTPGVVYLGHIPDGFTESAMREYFKQFGDVGRIRVACSRKTNRSKGYAFIEFKCDEVAKVVADTMNNYYMFEKLLKCVFIPKEEVKANLFKGHRPHQRLNFRKAVKEFNKPKTAEKIKESAKRRIRKLEKKRQRLAAMGIELKFNVNDSEEVKKWNLSVKEKASKLTSDNSVSKIDNASEDSSSGDENYSFGKIFSTDVTDSSKYTLEMDSSDDEISFTTPPNAKKVTKAGKKASNKKLAKVTKKPTFKANLKNKTRVKSVNKYSTPKK